MLLSVILPCYREETNLPAMLAVLQKALDGIAGEKEIIAIDDGSPDKTYETLLGLKSQYPILRIIRFARNFGKEAALSCGLRLAKGDAAVMLDADLQHPPEVIAALVEKWRAGDKVVYALRDNRDTDGPLRRLWSKAFYRLFSAITELNLPEGAGDFRLLDRKVVDAVNLLPERTRFMKGLMTWVGFQAGFVSFHPAPRAGGESSWSFKNLLVLALSGLTAFSNLPLRIWSLFGFVMSGIATVYGVYLVVTTWVSGSHMPGFPSIMCGILFMGGLQLISLGVIGEYIGRIFTEVKDRPLYIIAEDHA